MVDLCTSFWACLSTQKAPCTGNMADPSRCAKVVLDSNAQTESAVVSLLACLLLVGKQSTEATENDPTVHLLSHISTQFHRNGNISSVPCFGGKAGVTALLDRR